MQSYYSSTNNAFKFVFWLKPVVRWFLEVQKILSYTCTFIAIHIVKYTIVSSVFNDSTTMEPGHFQDKFFDLTRR